MKILTILMFMITGYYCYAQDSSANEFSVLFNTYFESVDSTTNNRWNVYARPYYMQQTAETKMFVISKIVPEGKGQLLYVHYENKRELWERDNASNKAVLLDTLDLDNVTGPANPDKPAQKLVARPWFSHWGIAGSSYGENYMLYFDGRIGFFLLRNRWDMALSTSVAVSDVTSSLSIGLVSKYYFPIRKYKISPYIGGGIMGHIPNLVEEETLPSSIDISCMTGLSWLFGPGNLDVGLQYDKEVIFTVGYTFMFSGGK